MAVIVALMVKSLTSMSGKIYGGVRTKKRGAPTQLTVRSQCRVMLIKEPYKKQECP